VTPMAATRTVAQVARLRKPSDSVLQPAALSSAPMRSRRGVVVLFGYGTSVRVDRGHLVVEDGVGSDRYKNRFPRVGHGLKRLVVIGADGVVSLSALRWLADQNASFVMLERNGGVLATTGPVRPSDVRLRPCAGAGPSLRGSVPNQPRADRSKTRRTRARRERIPK
jgi:hypothetical protein